MSDRRIDRRRFVAGSATLTGLAAGVPFGAASDSAGKADANATGAGEGSDSVETDENRGQTDHEGASAGTLTAGVAIRDVTPANGQPFFGYARPDILADGVSIRLFDVVPATGLVVRGVRAGEPRSDGSVTLTVLAQNPPPDPDDSLRTRVRSPHGGTATIEVDGETVVATWDEAAGGWVGTTQGVAEGDVVTLPDAGLEDAFGNRSGDAVQLTVGEVADVEWPQNMTTGGGDPPGLFGIGTIPI